MASPSSELGSRSGGNYGDLTGNSRVSAALNLPHPSLGLNWEAPERRKLFGMCCA